MSKISIIGLGLVGNSIGMGLKSPANSTSGMQIVGFDPERTREDSALRRYGSVDQISPDLESAVRGADVVIISTPGSAAREVLAAIEPFLSDGATVTDTLSTKEPVMSWAGELLGNRVSFVGGHPLSRTVDIDSPKEGDAPSASLFLKAPYCIMPLPSASGDALNSVIGIAEMLGARPLFIDPREHDSLFAAAGHLSTVAAAGILRVLAGSPSWQDIGALASGSLENVTAPVQSYPDAMADVLLGNRQALLHWIDQYLLALQDMRDLLASGDSAALLPVLNDAHAARTAWLQRKSEEADADALSGRRPEATEELRVELQQAIRDTRPGSRMLGKYLGDRMFGKKDK